MADPYHNMNPNFANRVRMFIAASGGRISPGSGYRDIQEQIALRRSNGCPDIWESPASSCRIPTAIPGRSNHNHGLAMDLRYSGDGATWAAQNAHRFGLHFPVKGENWHVEAIDMDSSGHYSPEQAGPVAYNIAFQDGQGQRNPEDELAYRMSTVMDIVMGGTPEPIEPDEPVQAPNVNDAISGIALQQNPVEQQLTLQQQPAGGGGGPAAEGDRLGNARIIAQVGREMGAPDNAIKIALAAALVESNLINVNYGDRDSLGLFQQRPSQGWGTPDQVRDPRYAARQFYSRLLGMNWQGMNPGAAAQAVQRSAFPERYGQRYGEASSIFSQLGV